MGDKLPAVDLGDNTVQEVAAGQSHTCVLLTSGEVACWGFNFYGQACGVGVLSPPFERVLSVFCVGSGLPCSAKIP